ncbi:MAG: malto-oligosyltrehalose synthase [Nitrospirota bacterium]
METEGFSKPRIPVSTYRLQFNGQFRFSDAERIIPYLHEIGITDIYSSPYFRSRKNSIHGYDIVDPSALNPEVGTEDEYNELIKELKKHQMGQILDIVPNHMCIESRENIWWMDVLENGPSSVYAKFFDIDWKPVKKELQNKVLLPVLGDQYGKALENQELKLKLEEGRFFVCYYEHRFPVSPRTYIYILQHRMDSLENLLSKDTEDFKEYLGIISALNDLPPYTEKNPLKIKERHLKQKDIKERLRVLCNNNAQVRGFIEENIGIFNGVKGIPKSFDLLDKLLNRQAYRLSYWRVAIHEINYRRFFDINSLGSIRMEELSVFNETHRLVFRLIREGKVTGLRVDHPDGLYDPSKYFHLLQKGCYLQARSALLEKLKEGIPPGNRSSFMEPEITREYDELLSSDPQGKPFYIVGEKILTKGERMPDEWPIFSTTGYVFMNSLNGIFVETKNAKAFERIYSKFIRESVNFHDIVYNARKLIMNISMSSEINTLGHYLNDLSEKNRHTRDFTLNSLTDVIKEVIAFFPVYRTYINSYEVADRDRQYIELAVSKAKRKNPAINTSVFDFLKDVLLLNFPDDFSGNDKKEWLDFVMRFQQITGPLMAKGVEDTAFYIYNRLVSLNEVGGMPERFGTPLETFHGQNIERNKFWPHALITASTHDSKRSEDVRARINVLSEIPEEWKKRLLLWDRLNRKKKLIVDNRRVPDRNEEYLLYQTLIGAWPINIENEYEDFKKRIKEYMIKALREAKINTSWINPDAIYEEALLIFIDSVLSDTSGNRFLNDFRPFQKMISDYGMSNSLSQTLLKITSPGVPDFYQGTEIWNFSLVDPDNRRPVDYGTRKKMLEEIKRLESEIGILKLAKELTASRNDGRIKLYVICKALNYRKNNRQLFEGSEYIPLEIHGEMANNICAFSRVLLNRRVIVVVPRFLTQFCNQTGDISFPGEEWEDSFLAVPFDDAGAGYMNVFTGEILTVRNQNEAAVLNIREIFGNFPVALLDRVNG